MSKYFHNELLKNLKEQNVGWNLEAFACNILLLCAISKHVKSFCYHPCMSNYVFKQLNSPLLWPVQPCSCSRTRCSHFIKPHYALEFAFLSFFENLGIYCLPNRSFIYVSWAWRAFRTFTSTQNCLPIKESKNHNLKSLTSDGVDGRMDRYQQLIVVVCSFECVLPF